MIEFAVASISVTIHNREMILHYKVDGDKVSRVDPVVLSPRDFVDEWLTQSWGESSGWSEWAHREALHQWHRKLYRGSVEDFIHPTKHCKGMPDLRQVGVTFRNPSGDVYFLVRWKPPYRFSLVEASAHANPRCLEEDLEADEPRTLFPDRR